MHQDRFVTLRGRRFHYTEWGPANAPPLILLHGVTGHARTWDDEARELAGTFRVLALDQRGHGDSEPAPDGDYTVARLTQDLAAFVDALGLARVSLVALSMGGRVAIAYAAAHPERVDRLVVVDIGPDIAPEGRARVGMMLAATPERFETLDHVIDWMRAANPRYSDSLLRHRAEHGVRALPEGGFTWKYDRALRDSVRSGRWRDPIDLWPAWQRLSAPTLVVRGAVSDVLSADTAKRMVDSQPRARLVEIAGAGHTVSGDQPAAFMAAVQAFFAA